jgi:alpha-glucosidase
MAYYGEQLRGFQLPFNFHLIGTRWDAAALRKLIDEYESMLPPGAWPNWVLGNHDRSRIASRIGPAQARVAAVLLCTLRGTPTLYYGDELGMLDVPIPAEAVQDPYEKNVPGLGLGRDPERTPMQWSPEPHAGFSSAPPWLPLAADYASRNVALAQLDPSSMLSLYRELLRLRRARPTLSVGAYASLDTAPDVLGYVRSQGSTRDGVLLNLSGTSRPVSTELANATVLVSTHPDRAGRACGVSLEPNEAVVLSLAN